ncbi:MAG TPA: CpsB/CapC family capsule biosynthesis tyrosine phosphatase, partial [Chloroflexota bacterium]|nr:CpsB/CapC family capsule biosynthesis tyrosine phosphatase [Chloroflexota bacterium]
MIDLHNHILPGVDDGAETLEDSLAMARMALDDGIKTIVATPHRNSWTYHEPAAEAHRRLAELKLQCQEASCDVELILGSEAFIAPDLAEQIKTGLALTINGSRYLLIEWAIDQFPAYADQAIFDLRVQGIVPIIAHAERYRAVQRDVDLLASLVRRGAMVQVTAASLIGDSGSGARRASEQILVANLGHVLATDSHSVERRPPTLATARARAEELIGT